ncbi:MAG TPA: M20/M25/M40 family metallo-hydrolase [Solirubrobacteraceae bacterium]|nr:M20/M25/M40 family metallo-hydrolase [Solirubrobacteraceae bacterium]
MSDRGAEAAELLAELLRINTVNPPGNERPAQELIAARLAAAGVQSEMLGAQPGRPNLVASLRGEGEGPALCLLGHVDTVLATPSEWSHDPWSGDEADGYIWGRGALDMKNQVAAELAAVLSLARDGWRPARGELKLVTVADEETGGELGAEWITREHPDKVRCDMLINEGGGAAFDLAGKRCYGVCCAEKGVFRFTVRTNGVAGHASMPAMGDNALLKMAPILASLGESRPGYRVTDAPLHFLRGIGEDPDDVPGAIERLRANSPLLAIMLEPMFAITFTPTRISASEKINVIPSRAELRVDCRVPPGLGAEEVRSDIADVLGEDGFEIEFTEEVVGNRSPAESSLMDAIAGRVAQFDPDAIVVPVVLPGFTDSRHFRDAFPECVAYGFFPQRHQTLLEGAPLIHGADERIDARDLALAADFYADLVTDVLG